MLSWQINILGKPFFFHRSVHQTHSLSGNCVWNSKPTSKTWKCITASAVVHNQTRFLSKQICGLPNWNHNTYLWLWYSAHIHSSFIPRSRNASQIFTHSRRSAPAQRHSNVSSNALTSIKLSAVDCFEENFPKNICTHTGNAPLRGSDHGSVGQQSYRLHDNIHRTQITYTMCLRVRSPT